MNIATPQPSAAFRLEIPADLKDVYKGELVQHGQWLVANVSTDRAGWGKMLVPYNSSSCPHLPPLSPPLLVPEGRTLTFLIDLTQARTILLRRQACSNWIGAICANKDRWDDIVLFSETNFATLFGGRSVTLDWFFSQGE